MLKKITTLLILLAFSGFAFADNQIAVISVDKIIMSTKAGKSIVKQIEDLQSKFKDKVAKLQKDFDGQKNELDKQKTVLSKEAFAKKEAEFSSRYSEARKQLQQETANNEQMQQRALGELNSIAMEVIKNIAQEAKYSQVFSTEFLVYADAKSDITSQVIAAIDKKIDNITFKSEPSDKK